MDATTVAITPGLALDPDHSTVQPPNTIITYTHILTNIGNSTDTYTMTVTPSGSLTISHNIPATITLAPNVTASFIITVTVPATATSSDQNVTIITATSSLSPSLSATDVDTTTVSSQTQINLAKSAQTASTPLVPGDFITYTLAYSNGGTINLTNVVITDMIPANTVFVGSSVSSSPVITVEYFNGSTWGVTDLGTATQGLRWLAGTLPPDGLTRYVTFTVQVSTTLSINSLTLKYSRQGWIVLDGDVTDFDL
ncbi:MAG: DUF11 domain-containing protein, partial [Alteromonas sp.]|nr:DUF11 domain-containing protein [Alteromonas sp.]